MNVVRHLLEAGAQPEGYRDGWQYTALHQAVRCGDIDVVEELLDHGADIHVLNVINKTPLHEAALCGHVDVVDLLLQRGAQLECVDKDGNTPFHDACMEGHQDVARLLVEEYGAGHLLGVKGEHNRTPCEQAEAEGHTSVVKCLREAKAKPHTGEPSFF